MTAMRVLMLTNTYRPVVSGVTRSILAFEAEYRRLGQEVLVIAPYYVDADEDEPEVLRVPALQHVNGSEFSVPVPLPARVGLAVDAFRPDVVHSHHPFFIGATAMRLARARNLPLVFTHHTMYDQYTHYLSSESQVTSRFIGSLTAGYANLCDAVIAPSDSVAQMLREREVATRIEVIPTGVDLSRFQSGDGRRFREQHRIPRDAFLVGYVGRLAPEKNLGFLADAVTQFLNCEPRAHFVAIGGGPMESQMRGTFQSAGIADRLRLPGVCDGQELIDAFHALDVFAFASQTETQGMVVTEAMAAGVPVVAIDGPGVRDVVRDGFNGRLLPRQDIQHFAEAVAWVSSLTHEQRTALSSQARETAEQLSMPRQADRVLKLYETLIDRVGRLNEDSSNTWSRAIRRIEAEWELLSNVAHTAGCALDAEGGVTAVTPAIRS